MGVSGVQYAYLGYMGAKDFDGINEHFKGELRERLSQSAYKELVPTLQYVARPNFRQEVEREREENEAVELGFLLVRQETQLAILETARRAICIVQTIVFCKRFKYISQLL